MTRRRPRRTTQPGGGSYRALVGLSYPSDPDIVARIRNGDHVPVSERQLRTVEAGEVVDDIPTESIPWLLEAGMIEAVGFTPAPDPAPELDAGEEE